MMCAICGGRMAVVCGEPQCGTCFGRVLEADRGRVNRVPKGTRDRWVHKQFVRR